MKIAYIYDVIYPYVKGGAEKRFWELARRLVALGHEAHLYGIRSWEGASSITSEGVHIHGIGKPAKLYSKKGTRNISPSLSFTLSLLPELNKENFDIIDCNAFPYLTFFPVKRYASSRKIPLVMTWQEVWGKYWLDYFGLIKGSIGCAIERNVIHSSEYVIAHSKKTREALLSSGFRGKEARIISHGVESGLIGSLPPDKEKSDLLFTGRLIKDKNVGLFIRALALVKKELPFVKTVIVGEGPEKDKLLSLTEGLGLKDNIRFTGFLEYKEVISCMKASKAFIFPSSREGFGIVAIEAMSSGLPVITVDRPMNAATELVKDGENGFISDFNPEALALKIKQLLKDEPLRLRMSEAAQKAVSGNDWEKITGITLDFYKEIIKKAC